MTFTFKVFEKIKEAWVLYKNNFKDIMPLALIMIVIQFLSQNVSKNNDNWLLTLILMMVSVFISYLWYKSTLDLLDGKKFKPFSKETIPTWAKIWDFVKTNILMVLCILPFFIVPILVIGVVAMVSLMGGATVTPAMVLKMLIFIIPIFILFIIPSIYISARLFPAKYLSVDKTQGARKSVKEAWLMTKGNGWSITWKIILVALFVILGFLLFVVGFLVTFPLGMIVLAMMYKELAGKTNNSEIISEQENPKVETREEVIVEVIKEETK